MYSLPDAGSCPTHFKPYPKYREAFPPISKHDDTGTRTNTAARGKSLVRSFCQVRICPYRFASMCNYVGVTLASRLKYKSGTPHAVENGALAQETDRSGLPRPFTPFTHHPEHQKVRVQPRETAADWTATGSPAGDSTEVPGAAGKCTGGLSARRDRDPYVSGRL